ncbi:MAG: VCBS repeat-containing protein [Planctomycetes bacterium]|nr:VCBS repeat-containing protein [Planctomycetota bacterium]
MRPSRIFSLAAPLAAVLASSAWAQPLRLRELHRMMPFDADSISAMAVGDVDGDGDLDLYLGGSWTYLSQPDRLYINSGAGAFVPTVGQLPGSLVGSRAVVLGDVDGDGDLDAFLGNGGQDRLALNDGSGNFVDATSQVPPNVDDTRAVALGDVDGDGDLDAWVGNNYTAAADRLYLNDGSGSFSDATSQLPPPPSWPPSASTYAVALADVDGDGDLDAFLGGTLRLYLNNGSGIFSDATSQISVSFYYSVGTLALGDLDGDGDLDAFLGIYYGYYTNNYRLYRNNGSGVFTDVSSLLPAVASLPSSIALGDVEGDGDLDVLVGNSYPPNHLLLNNGVAGFTDGSAQLPSLPSGDPTKALALGDADGDGDVDALLANGLAYGNPSARQDRLYLNDGSGAFTDVTAPQSGLVDATWAVALGDLDGDGDLDALAGNSGQNRFFVNDGGGSFAVAANPPPAIGNGTRGISLGDADGDGDLDALVGTTGASRLFRNLGTGTFLPQIFPGGACDAVALADVDGDGDLDALLGRYGQDSLFLNDGSALLTDATGQLPAILDDTNALALGDLDGDGDLDVLVGNGGQDRVFVNNGAGTFTDATSLVPADDDGTAALALGDVDGDGDLDAMLGNAFSSSTSGAQNRLLVNDGSGSFSDATNQLPAILGATHALALGDIDGDGDLDALVGNGAFGYYSTGDLNQVYLNNGSGTFVLATAALPLIVDDTRAVALGDLDGDGDLDAFVGNQLTPVGGYRFLYNLGRQLAWRAIPRAGKPLTLDLYGPPFGGALLAFSLGTANVPIPPLGTFRLDPGSVHQTLATLLDGQGRASVTYAVPALPALVGATVYWQALVGSPARFTNLEITTLSSL